MDDSAITTTVPAWEFWVPVEGARLRAQGFGVPTHPAVVLIHGAGASMLGWDEGFCTSLAREGRYVVRFDNRDTGLSTRYPAGEPDYALSDLARDAVAILDAQGIGRAHFVGRSMAGATLLCLGVDHPDRVASLTFIGTTPGDPDLPGMSTSFLEAVANEPDVTDDAAVTDYLVRLLRAYSGPSPSFDEDAARALAASEVARTGDMSASLRNHFLIDFDAPAEGGFADIAAPCLVIHGTADPVWPLAHGIRLAEQLNAELLVMADTGHELPAERWPMVIDALVRHTGSTGS